MKKITMSRTVSNVLFVLAVSASATTAMAQTATKSPSMPEPARWTQEDVTKEQKISTARKEAVAAQQSSIEACKLIGGPMYQACVTEARVNYQKDIAEMNKRFGLVK
jgi:hypothetical protein